MNKQLNLETQCDLIDVITERPFPFKLNGKNYFIYYPSLGTTLLIQRVLAKCKGSLEDIPEFCYYNRRQCCRIIALSVLCNRRQYSNEPLIKQIEDELYEALDMDGLCKLIYLVKTINDTSEMEQTLGLNEDDDTKRKIAKSKEQKGSSIVFGGRSIYGSLLDAACQRYGWSLEYVLWGLSFANLHFIMKDAINSVYLTEEERKKLHLRERGEEVIKADDPKNISLIRKFFKGE